MHPLTDIIVLVHNQLRVTQKFIEYLFVNTSNFNLIFIDNNSTDGTTDFLKEDDRWTVIESETNLGIVKGRNLGAQHITADYFVNIDNDQYPKEGWLDILHGKMNEGYDVVGKEAWKLVPPTKKGVVIGEGWSSNSRAYHPYHHCQHKNEKFTYIGCGGMLIKTQVYRDIGLFDEQFGGMYFEDPDFCWRVWLAGYKLAWCPECPIDHIGHSTIHNQKTFDKNEQFLQSWKLFRKKWNGWFPNEDKINA